MNLLLIIMLEILKLSIFIIITNIDVYNTALCIKFYFIILESFFIKIINCKKFKILTIYGCKYACRRVKDNVLIKYSIKLEN